ncbi:MAG: type II secretion system protein GspK [Candidatus Omnitrophica bacterium]|nr:type II secretion system protein GspK [Candidatus Omnitrophota bacterium]
MRKTEGTVLITSLWILAILSIFAVGIGFRVSIEARLAKYNMDSLKALYIAKAGAAKAMYRLAKNPASGDTLYECGTAFSYEERSDPAKAAAIFSDLLGEGYFNVAYNEDGITYPGMSDEERRININTASENILKNLLIYVGEDPTIASGIVQWRSPGPGLDDGYYESLPSPYKSKHARFSAPEELLLVKGMNADIFNKIKDHITVFGPDTFAVNINTAPKTVLSTIIMADASTDSSIDKITADFCADKIIALRSGYDARPGTKDDNKFTTAQVNLEQISQGALSATQSANLTKDFTISSVYFRIDSKGIVKKSKAEKRVVYIVRKEQGKAPKPSAYREY